MSQFDPVIGADKSGLAYRQDDNSGKKALLTHHKGPLAPEYAEAGILWLDDSDTPWLLKCHDGTGWITVSQINATDKTTRPYVGSQVLAESTSQQPGLARAATEAEAMAGVNDTAFMTPLKTFTAMKSGVPTGALMMFAMNTPPDGWLVRDGAEISRTAYADLFAVIGTTYGAGDGSTTFNLPDDQGLFERAWDEGGAVDPARVFGSYQADEFEAHKHIEGMGSYPTGTQGRYGQVNTGISEFNHTQQGNTTKGAYTSTEGGNETRPKNRAYLACIKY